MMNYWQTMASMPVYTVCRHKSYIAVSLDMDNVPYQITATDNTPPSTGCSQKNMINQRKLGKLLALIVIILIFASCQGGRGEEPVIYYQLIGEIEAFQEDGGVIYPEYIAASGIPEIKKDQIVIALPNRKEDVLVDFQHEQDKVIFTVQGVETYGKLNSWTRLNALSTSAFGYDTDCEIWFGTVEPIWE